MTRVPMDKLVEFGVAFMTKRGVPEDKARHMAEVVVEAEAFHRTTHGIVQYKSLHTILDQGIDPKADPKVIRDDGAVGLIDGEGCFAILAMKLAREMGLRKAREHGISYVSVRNTGWIGALGMHLIPIAREGMLAQAWAQSSQCRDCAPFGGIEACFSTNPIALAFPADGDPVVADFSTATMSMGAAGGLAKKGQKTDTTRFLDKEGNPTDDPAIMDDGGSLMFMGCEKEGYKGYALSLFSEALTVIAGASANNPDLPQRQSFGLTVIDASHFGESDHYRKEMKRFMAGIKATRPRAGRENVRLPGERGFAALAECRTDGVPLDEDKLQMLRGIAEADGLEPVE